MLKNFIESFSAAEKDSVAYSGCAFLRMMELHANEDGHVFEKNETIQRRLMA